MGLVDKQDFFTGKLAELIRFAQDNGYQVTLGEAWRPDVTAEYYAKVGKGIANSLHTKRLAIDLNVFREGALLSAPGYTELGEWWEKQSTPTYKCTWGGRFNDANHFSLEHEGVK